MRMLANATANTTTANTTTATSTTKEAASMTSASTKEKYTIKRATTTAKALTFSFEFTGLADGGKTYSFMCEATSLNPTNPQFRSKITEGTGITEKHDHTPTGAANLFSSLFAAIIMIAAVFFY